MNLVKCPRCDLNYIKEDEKYCKVCLREMKGDPQKDSDELCSVCNEAPSLPGRDVCLMCLKEMGGDSAGTNAIDGETSIDAAAVRIDPVSGMEEIIPEMDDDIPANEFREMAGELSSLESIREDEAEDDVDEDD